MARIFKNMEGGEVAIWCGPFPLSRTSLPFQLECGEEMMWGLLVLPVVDLRKVEWRGALFFLEVYQSCFLRSLLSLSSMITKTFVAVVPA